MGYLYTEEEIRNRRTEWILDQLSPEDREYCRKEALNLCRMEIPDEEDGHIIGYHEWLNCVAEETYRVNEHHRAQYCAEMGDC